MAAVNAQIEPGDTVAIWGCGPVGQFAIRSALMLGAGRVVAIDEVPERLAMAEAGGAETIDFSKAETIDFSKTDVYDELMKRTDKRGPDSCIDAVGCEASGYGPPTLCSTRSRRRRSWPPTGSMCFAKRSCVAVRLARSRFPASMWGWATRFRRRGDEQGLTHQDRSDPRASIHQLAPELIEEEKIDPSFVVTHPASLEEAPAMYKKFRDKEDGVIKVVSRPDR